MPRRRAVGLLVAGLLGFGLSPKRVLAGGKNVPPNLRFQSNPIDCNKASCSQGTKGKVCFTVSLPNKWGQTGCIFHCCYDVPGQPHGNKVCCAGPATVHGAVGNCCREGFNCGGVDGATCICNGTVNSKTGVCDCPPERVCGAGCCEKGVQCIHNECCPSERICGSDCCKKDEQCVNNPDQARDAPARVCKPYCKTESDPRKSHVYDPATQCCTKYGIEQKYKIQNFERCRETRVPRPGFKLDSKDLYCGPKGKRAADNYGKANFLPACIAHDKCYSTCGSDKSECDTAFTKTITYACKGAYSNDAKALAGCMKMVEDYTLAVTVGASIVDAYQDAQSEACQCCP